MAINFDPLMQDPRFPSPIPGPAPLPGPGQVPPLSTGGPAYQRPGIFGAIMNKLADPNFNTALLTTGLNLMRTPEFGKSGWDVAANALGTGIQTLDTLRQRERSQKQADEDRRIKEEQRGIENKRGDKQIDISQQQADTSRMNVEGDQKNKEAQLKQAEAQLNEAIRHNKSSEEIARLRAVADNIRANAYFGSTARNPADIQKMDRMKRYAMEKLGMDEIDADKYAMDYIQTAKGKSPRQLVIDAYQKKVQAWQEQQFDPTAVPTPEMREAWKQQAISEVKFAEEAGGIIQKPQGTIQRPAPAASSQPSASSTPAPASPQSGAPIATKNDATLKSIEAWKLKGATPEQIKILIATGGENPATYGY